MNSFLGVVLMHELDRVGNLVTWLVPLCVVLGLLLLGGMIMEVPKHTVSSRLNRMAFCHHDNHCSMIMFRNCIVKHSVLLNSVTQL